MQVVTHGWSCLVWLSTELIVCSFDSYMAEAIVGAFQSWHLESPLDSVMGTCFDSFNEYSVKVGSGNQIVETSFIFPFTTF